MHGWFQGALNVSPMMASFFQTHSLVRFGKKVLLQFIIAIDDRLFIIVGLLLTIQNHIIQKLIRPMYTCMSDYDMQIENNIIVGKC